MGFMDKWDPVGLKQQARPENKDNERYFKKLKKEKELADKKKKEEHEKKWRDEQRREFSKEIYGFDPQPDDGPKPDPFVPIHGKVGGKLQQTPVNESNPVSLGRGFAQRANKQGSSSTQNKTFGNIQSGANKLRRG